MAETSQAQNQNALPQELIQMIIGHLVSRLLHLAATLKLSDHLVDGPKSAEELARATATNPQALYRVMRTLASLGLYTEDSTHRFSLKPLGEALKSGTVGYATTLIIAGDVFVRPLEHLLYSVQTGNPAFEKTFGMPVFEWIGKDPEVASLFSQTVIGFHGAEPPAVAAAYDFSGIKTLVDVGGASGNLLSTILAVHRSLRGILFDLPHVVRDAPALLKQRGVDDRVEMQSGSFFETVPPGGDAYMLSHVIHDWSEEQCLTILGNCRGAMTPGARLLLVEMVLPSGDTPHPGKLTDIVMLNVPGGQERTEPEYRELLAKTGFRLTRVVPTESAASVIEAMPA
jgi:O-methyltransferase/methyltransferase family protein